MPNIIKTTNPTKRTPLKRVFVVIGAVLLVAAGVWGYFYWDTTYNKQSNQQEETSLKKLDSNGLAAEVNKLVAEKKYDEASELIKHQDEASTDPSKIIMQARILTERGDGEGALKLLREAAAKNDKEAYYYVGHEGYTLSAMGDKQAAIEKFNAAIDMASKVEIDSDDESARLMRSDRVGGYMFEIEDLKGRQ